MADRCDDRPNDRGAVLVISAAVMVALLALAAIVVDLGLSRARRGSAQSAVDLAALAAGDGLATDPAPDIGRACADAASYLRSNADDMPATMTVDCSSLPPVCSASTAPSISTDGGTGGRYTVEITYPVPDAMISDGRVTDSSGRRVNDGAACERMMVAIEGEFDTIFAGILGESKLDVGASAVVHQIPAVKRRAPSLWLLDPYGCDVLSVQGGSSVTVGSATVGGLVTIDSDASACSGNSYTIDAGGASTRIAAVPDTTDPAGEISLYAMEYFQTDCATGELHACDPADVNDGLVYPQPQRRPSRVTRAPVDHTWNCRTTSDSTGGVYPSYWGLSIPPCAGTPGSNYIDQLQTEVGASGAPSGFQRWSDSYGCNNPTVVAPLPGNWWVDCSTFKLTSASVEFSGGNVIFDGGISMTGGALAFNTANPAPALTTFCLYAIAGCLDQSSVGAAWVYMRPGANLTMTGGVLTANQTTIYQHSGYFSVAGGSPPIWNAPTEGPFRGLAAWSELSSNKFQINGGASMNLKGTFFTPEASPISISGGAPVVPQGAQFVTYRVAVSGGASLTLEPNPDTLITLPESAPTLIR